MRICPIYPLRAHPTLGREKTEKLAFQSFTEDVYLCTSKVAS